MNLPRTKLFTGSTMGNVEPQMQYLRLKKEGYGIWFKGQVTEAFPPEGESSKSPWDITLTGVGEPDQTTGKYNSYEATVWPGTVAGLLPLNIFSGGGLAKFSVGNGLIKFKGKCLTDGKQITSVQIVADSSDPPAQTLVPSALPAEAWFLFGMTIEGTAYRTIGSGNPGVILNQAVVTDKTQPPPPGVPGVDRWYQILFQ